MSLDAIFSEREHLVGDSLTLADMSVAVAANMAFVTTHGRERYAGTPTHRWLERVLTAPGADGRGGRPRRV